MKNRNTINEVYDYLFKNFEKIKINSKDVIKDDVFIALKGKKSHGNNYIKEVIFKDPKYIVTDKVLDINLKKSNIIVIVEDIYLFLLEIAKNKRKNFLGKIIGITGSVGKTSVKENLKFFLSSQYNVSASIKSYNNYLGVLISIINLDLSSDYAIFEIGTNNFNEIKKLTKLIKPSQVIITNILPTHLENFKDTHNIAIEKSNIFEIRNNPNVELLILPQFNSDEFFLNQLANNNHIKNIITFGNTADQDLNIQKILTIDDFFSEIFINYKNKLYNFKIKSNQISKLYNIIICFIIYFHNKLDINFFLSLTYQIPLIEGRGLETKIIIDKKIIKLIDESYNASPSTMRMCVDFFISIKTKKNQIKLLILGDMFELGEQSHKFHLEILNYIINCNITNVIVSGDNMKKALNEVHNGEKKIKFISENDILLKFIREKLNDNDILLIKGSNSSNINELGKILMNKKGE